MDLFSPQMITRLLPANDRSNQPLTRGGRPHAGDDGGLLRALAMHPLGDGPPCFIGAIGTRRHDFIVDLSSEEHAPAGRLLEQLLRESSTVDVLRICTPSLVVSSSVDMYNTAYSHQ